MNYKMGWKGTVAFQAFTPGNRELLFDLAEGLTVPDEFKEGDEIDIQVHPDHPANIQMGMNSGYYEFTHLKSGVSSRYLTRPASGDSTKSASRATFVYSRRVTATATRSLIME